MTIRVALTHRTTYTYDRPITLAPHVVRLRPAPHTRTPVVSYSLKVEPGEQFLNWQQDAFANWQARFVFPEKANKFEVLVDVVADMVAINPFDFFLEEDAQEMPFTYEAGLKADLAPYLVKPKMSPVLQSFINGAPAQKGMNTNDWLVAINQYVQGKIDYTVRMEPGVQTPEETITKALGSCRDSGWLLVAMFRELGYAARFVSGYLIQLTSDQKAVDGPSGPQEDFTDLHAWTEIYLPGAGWVGLDPTSGLFAGEGHIPLACTPEPSSAAPITGAHEKAEVTFDFDMKVERIAEPPRHTKPLTEAQWAEIDRAGKAVDKKLKDGDVRLTMGGEPTFVAAYDRDAKEWTTDAVGPTKRTYADKLVRRLRDKFAPGGVLHYGQGKWYPGEQLPRWAFSLYWRADAEPMWRDDKLVAPEGKGKATHADAGRFMARLCKELSLPEDFGQETYEDPSRFLLREHTLPENVVPQDSKLDDPQERSRLARVFDHGFTDPVAYVLPVQLAQVRAKGGRSFDWMSEIWETRRGKLFLIPGDSPAGFRLPLGSLQWLPEDQDPQQPARDPMARTQPLRQSALGSAPEIKEIDPEDWREARTTFALPGGPVRTALTVEERNGVICVFMPPTGSVDEFLDLLGAVEETAKATKLPIHLEGYEPPRDPRVNVIRVTPDPGVIEINIHPAQSWDELREIADVLYEEARQENLDSSTFQVDGRPTGSGGGNHIVVGGSTPADSPFLRRPDLLGSIIRYWQRHPSLSYLFSGMFIGPTSQAPRLDEARHDSLYEMEIALKELQRLGGTPQPWLVDRLFRHMLTDLTGNTHRAEICIDKMFSPDGPTGRLGLVEFRGFEMPPHWQMSMAQALVLRGLIAWFWEEPYTAPLIPHGTHLHDRYLLPDYVMEDFGQVLDGLSNFHGFPFERDWFGAQLDFRFPVVGSTMVGDAKIELRSAIEPWLVLGEESTAGGTARFVDSSVERVQVKLTGFDATARTLCCNGYAVPLDERPDGSFVAGVRFRSWQPWSALHPTIPAHGPLRFDVFDRYQGRSTGGCVYHVAHPGGRAHETRPINALEAEGRRLARFEHGGQNPDLRQPEHAGVHPHFPLTLDLRRV
ncbi:MAG: transglutaminase family protein [Pseudomonadota bacterium]